MSKKQLLVIICIVLTIVSIKASAEGINIQFKGLTNGQIVRGMQVIEVGVQVLDGEKIESVTILLDDEVLYATEFAPYKYFWNTASYPDNVYTLRAVVKTKSTMEEAGIPIEIQNHPLPNGKVVYMWDFEEEPERWGPGPNLLCEISDEAVLRGEYSAKYIGQYIYSTIATTNNLWGQYSGPGFFDISPNKQYYIEGWMKIDELKSDHFDVQRMKIVLQLFLRDKSGASIKAFNSNPYDLSKMGTWQKVIIECSTPQNAHLFYLRINTNTSNQDVLNPEKTIDVKMYIDEVKIIEKDKE